MNVASKSEISRYWRIVLGSFVGVGGGFASLYFYTSGLFIKPLAEEFGWTRGEASLGSLATMIGVIAFPLAGWAIDRFGEVRVALVSGLALASSFAMLAFFVSGLMSYVLLVMFLTFVASGTLPIGYNRIVVRHFREQRGLALGMALTGTAVGSALVAPLLAPVVGLHGWRLGYLILAGLTLVLTFVALFLLKPFGQAGSREVRAAERDAVSWRTICSNPAFAPTSIMIFLSAIAVLGTAMHIIPLLTDRGLSFVEAGVIASALGFSVIGGRLVTGWLLDRWDAGLVTWGLFTLAALGALALWTEIPILTVPGAMLIGFGIGTEGDLLAYLLGRRFSAKSFGSVYGAIFGVHALGGGLGGVLAGASFDWTGGYGTWLFASSIALGVAGLIAFATERNVKIYQEDSAT